MTPADRERWACWFDETAAHADDITDGQADGLRLAAEHLRSDFINQQVTRITPATTSPEETA